LRETEADGSKTDGGRTTLLIDFPDEAGMTRVSKPDREARPTSRSSSSGNAAAMAAPDGECIGTAKHVVQDTADDDGHLFAYFPRTGGDAPAPRRWS